MLVVVWLCPLSATGGSPAEARGEQPNARPIRGDDRGRWPSLGRGIRLGQSSMGRPGDGGLPARRWVIGSLGPDRPDVGPDPIGNPGLPWYQRLDFQAHQAPYGPGRWWDRRRWFSWPRRLGMGSSMAGDRLGRSNQRSGLPEICGGTSPDPARVWNPYGRLTKRCPSALTVRA